MVEIAQISHEKCTQLDVSQFSMFRIKNKLKKCKYILYLDANKYNKYKKITAFENRSAHFPVALTLQYLCRLFKLIHTRQKSLRYTVFDSLTDAVKLNQA